MFKKLSISFVTLFTVLGCVYLAYNADIHAASNYNTGGTVSGRINKAPSGLTNANFAMRKGDKVYLSKTDKTATPFQLIREETYTDYGCTTVAAACSQTEPIQAWFSLSSSAIAKINPNLKVSDYIVSTHSTEKYDSMAYYKDSALFTTMSNFNNSLTANSKKIIKDRNLTVVHNVYKLPNPNYYISRDKDFIERGIFSETSELGAAVFTPSFYELGNYDDLTYKDFKFSEDYWSPVFFHYNLSTYPSCKYSNFLTSSSGYPGIYTAANNYTSLASDIAYAGSGTAKALRGGVSLSMEDVVFGVAEGSKSGFSEIKQEVLNESYTDIYASTSGFQPMKLRIHTGDVTLTAQLEDIVNDAGDVIKQANQNSSIYLKATANSGATEGIHTVSVLVFDENNNFKYYKPIAAANGASNYELDTTGLPVGKYKIAIVNEDYNEDNNSPQECSYISDIKELEIVKELSDLKWKDSVSDANDFFEADRNVNKDDLIGTITSKNGVQPITYELIAPASGLDSSSKFKINKNNSGEIIYNNDKSVNIYASEKLKAGNYRFKIKATDSSGSNVEVKTNDIEIIVFPSSKDIKFTPEKKNNKWYTVNDISSTTLIGTLSLNPTFSLSGVNITYSIKDVKIDGAASNDLEITSANTPLGKITAKGTPKAGEHTFTAVVNFRYQGKTYTIEANNQELTIAPNLYFVKTADSSTKITEMKVTYTDVAANQNFAVFAKGADHLQYRIKSSSSKDGVISLINANTGIFKMDKIGTTNIEAFLMDGSEEITSAELKIIVENAKLDNLNFTKDDNPVQDGKIIETYQPKGTFQLGIQNAPDGSTITYELKDKQTSNGKTLEDVIKVSSDGEVTILNASETHQINKVIVVATVKKTGYADETLEVFINIDQAEQTTFDFPTSNYEEVVEAGDGSFDVNFQKGGSSGDIEMMSEDARITFEGNTVKYEGIEDETILIKAYQKGDRNYKDSAEKTMKLTALKQGETKFTVDITPNKLIYGSTAQFKPKSETDVTYTYEADPSTIDIADVDSSFKDMIIGKKVGNAKFIITRYLNGVENGKTYKTIKVYPKTITVSVKDKTKKVGEALPTYELNTINGIVGNDNLGTPTFRCSATAMSPKGEYAITAEFPDSEVLKNYELTGGGIKAGKLTVTQDEGDKAWYEILGTQGDNNWYTSDVQIKLLTGNDYDAFSQNQSDWKDMIEVKGEGVYPLELWFKNTISGALSTSVKETIKIDGTGPEIESIKAVNSNSTIENILNDISFGNFFKPGTKIQIYTNDQTSNKDIETSKTKEVSYNIYPLDAEGKEGTAITGTAQSSSEKATITLNNTGRYKVCAIAKDNAGNTGEEQCAKVSIKDPEKDYDPNDLGCPSVNVTLGTGKAVLNIDQDGDGIPDMDIDTNGDGKADINIDNDKDGKPDTNLVILKEWNPKICSTTEHSYGYVEGIEPEINIALDADKKLPSLNIDIDGDMKADINVDTNTDKKADINIMKFHVWKPEKDCLYEGFAYDTMEIDKKKDLEINIDTDGDGLPDLNLDIDNDGKIDLNFDNDGDWIPDVNIDSDGDGKADINIDTNKDGEPDENVTTISSWKPDKNDCIIDGFKYDTMSGIEAEDPINELIHDSTGIIVEQVNAKNSFKKSQYILVKDVTNNVSNSEMNKVKEVINNQDQDIKRAFEAKLYDQNIEVQPNGTIKVKIPLTDDLKAIKNRKVIVQQADGSYKVITPIVEGEYLSFETDYLGKIFFAGDKDSVDTGGGSVEKSVQGVSTVKNYANTGDNTNVRGYLLFMSISLLLIIILVMKRKKETKDY